MCKFQSHSATEWVQFPEIIRTKYFIENFQTKSRLITSVLARSDLRGFPLSSPEGMAGTVCHTAVTTLTVTQTVNWVLRLQWSVQALHITLLQTCKELYGPQLQVSHKNRRTHLCFDWLHPHVYNFKILARTLLIIELFKNPDKNAAHD